MMVVVQMLDLHHPSVKIQTGKSNYMKNERVLSMLFVVYKIDLQNGQALIFCMGRSAFDAAKMSRTSAASKNRCDPATA